MGFQGSSSILLLIVAVLHINAWTVVPGERSVVSKNGTTRSVSKYIFYPDSENRTRELNRGDFDLLLKDIKSHNDRNGDSNDAYRIYVKRKIRSGRPPIRLRTETVKTVSSPVDAHYVVSTSGSANNEDILVDDASSGVISSSKVISSPQESKVYVLKMSSNGAKVRPQFNFGSSSSKVISIPRAREIREGLISAQGSDESLPSEGSGHIEAQFGGHNKENLIVNEPGVDSFEDLTRFLELRQDIKKSAVVNPSALHKTLINYDIVHGQKVQTSPSQVNPSHSNDVHSPKEDEVINFIKSYVKLRQDGGDAARLRSQFDFPSSSNVISIPLVRTRSITNNENDIAKKTKVNSYNDLLKPWQIEQENGNSPVAPPYVAENKNLDDSDLVHGGVILPFEKVIHYSTKPWDLEQENEKSPVVGPSVVELQDHDNSKLVHKQVVLTSPSSSDSNDVHSLKENEVINLMKSYLDNKRQNGGDVASSSLNIISIPLVKTRPITNKDNSKENLIKKEPEVNNINDLLRPWKIEPENEESPVVHPFFVEHKDIDNSDEVHGPFIIPSSKEPEVIYDSTRPWDLKQKNEQLPDNSEVIDLIKSFLIKMRQNRGDEAPSSLRIISIPLVRTRPITNNGESGENLSKEPKVDNINDLLRPWIIKQENEKSPVPRPLVVKHKDIDNSDVVHKQVKLPFAKEPEEPEESDSTRSWDIELETEKSPVVSESVVEHADLDTASHPSSSSNVISIPLVRVRTITNDDQENPKSAEAEVENNDYLTTSLEHEPVNEKSPVTEPSVVERKDHDNAYIVQNHVQKRGPEYDDYGDGYTTSWEHEQDIDKSPVTVPSVVEHKDHEIADLVHKQVQNQGPEYDDYGDGYTTSWEHEQDIEKSPVTNPSVVVKKDHDNSDLVHEQVQNRGEEYDDYGDGYTSSWEHELEIDKSPVTSPSIVVKKDLSNSSPSQTIPSHSNEIHPAQESDLKKINNDDLRNRFDIKMPNSPELISNFFEFGPHKQVNENQISSILIHNINLDTAEIDGSEIHVPVQIDCVNHPELNFQLLHNSKDQLNGCVSLDDQGTLTFLFNLVRQLQQRPNRNNEILIELIKKIIEKHFQSQHSASQNIQVIKFILYLYNLQQQNPDQNIQTIINSNQHLINLWIHQNPNTNIQIPDSKKSQIVIDLFKELNNLNQERPNKKTGLIISILKNLTNQFEHNHNVQIDPSQGSYILVLLQNFINQQQKAPVQNPVIVELIQKIKYNLEQLINQSSPEINVQKPNQIIQAIIDIIIKNNDNKPLRPHDPNGNSSMENKPTVEDLNIIIQLFNLDHIKAVINSLLQLRHSHPNDQAIISKWLVVFHSIFEILEERQNQNIHQQNVVTQLVWFLAKPERKVVLDLLQQNWLQYIIEQLKNNNINVLNNPQWTPYLQIWLIQLKNVKPDSNSPNEPDNPNDVVPDHEKLPSVEDLNAIIQLFTIDHIREVLHSLLQLQHSETNDLASKWLEVFHSIFEIFKERQNQNIHQQNVVTQLAWFLAKPERKVVLDLLQQNWLQYIVIQLKNNNINVLNNPQWTSYLQIWLIQLKKVKPNNNYPIQPDNSNNVVPDHEKIPSLEDLNVIIELINIDHIKEVINALLQLQHSHPNDQAAVSKWLVVFHSIFEILEERQYQNIDKQNVVTQLAWFLARPDRQIVLNLLQQKWFQYIIVQLNNDNLNILNNPEWNPYLQIWLIQLKNVKPDNNSPIQPDKHNEVLPDQENNPTVQDFNVIINVFTLDHIRAILNKLEQILYIHNNDVTKWREIFRLIFEVFKIREDLDIDKLNPVAQKAWFSANPVRRYVLNLLQQQWLQQIMVQLKKNNLQVLKNPQWTPYLQIWLIQLEKVKHQGIIIDHNNHGLPDYNTNQPHNGQLTISLEDSLAILDLLISHIRNAPNGFCPKRILDSLAVYLQQNGHASLVINSLVHKYSTLVDAIIQNRQNIYSQCY